MPRPKRSRGVIDVNIETHLYNERILPSLRVNVGTLDFVKDNMPNRDLMDAPVHGWTHILHMLVYASELCQYADFDPNVVRWAILVHDSGHYFDDREESEHGKMGAFVFTNMSVKAEREGTPIPVLRERVNNIIQFHAQDACPSSSTEEAIVRACDRLDLWRLPGFQGLKPELMEAPGWRIVEKMAKQMRLEGTL